MPVRLAVAVCAALLSLSSPAQDTKAGGCTANENSPAAECPRQPGGSGGLDWVRARDVPPELRDETCVNCGGRYMDPLAGADTSKDPGSARIEAHATSTELRGNTVTLTGGVEATQGYRHLRGDSAEIDRIGQTGVLIGNISLREPGLLLLGERADVSGKTGEASITESEFVLHEEHLRGAAGMLQRDRDGVIHVHDGNISFCAPGENDWSIRADNLELDLAEGLGTARGAWVDIADVPVFYTPWMQFPLDDRRRTGFLWPDLGSDSRGGLDIAAPIYFNIRPNWDAIYAPRYIEERGLNHEVQLRHLNRYVGSWEVGGAWMGDDKRYRDEYPLDNNHDRWLAMIRHKALFNQRWRSRVDYSRVSDANYMKDLESSSIDSKRRTALLQLGSLDYLGDRWLLEAELQQFQSLADDLNDDYKKLPQITARYRADAKPFELDPILLAQYSNFDADDNRVTGQRVYSELGAAYPMRWSYGFLQPTAKYRQLNYDLNRNPDYPESSPSTGTGLLSLDGGLFFDRQTRFAGRSLLQTLEPRVYYLYSEYEDQRDQPDFDSAELTFSYNQLFRETRFSGHDRLDDANQLSVGLTTRYIDNENGREKFSATIGQILYFEDYQVRLNPGDPVLDNSRSEMAGELTFDPNDRFNLRTSAIWDPNNDRMDSGNFQASYRWDSETIASVGYTFRRPLETAEQQSSVEQIHFSTYLPVGRRWAFFTALNYSLKANKSVEDMVGVEYDSCCWKVRLLYLRYYDTVAGQNPDFDDPDLTRENSTQVQFILKGMGGFGDRITSIMEDMIRGFRDVEY